MTQENSNGYYLKCSPVEEKTADKELKNILTFDGARVFDENRTTSLVSLILSIMTFISFSLMLYCYQYKKVVFARCLMALSLILLLFLIINGSGAFN